MRFAPSIHNQPARKQEQSRGMVGWIGECLERLDYQFRRRRGLTPQACRRQAKERDATQQEVLSPVGSIVSCVAGSFRRLGGRFYEQAVVPGESCFHALL